MPRTLHINVLLLKFFVGQKTFDPVCKDIIWYYLYFASYTQIHKYFSNQNWLNKFDSNGIRV